MHQPVSITRPVFVCLLLLAPALGYAATPSPTPSPNPAAPLDRYFGSMQMSPIGIRQGINFLGRSYEWRTMTDEQIVHEAAWIEQALVDWQQKYPNDPWLAPTAFHLMELYAEVQTPEARGHATDMLNYIAANWPATKYGHLARVRLAEGFPPFHEEPAMRPTFTPTPTPTPFGMTPTPTPLPTATPTPTPTATPTPSPTRRPRHMLFGR